MAAEGAGGGGESLSVRRALSHELEHRRTDTASVYLLLYYYSMYRTKQPRNNSLNITFARANCLHIFNNKIIGDSV